MNIRFTSEHYSVTVSRLGAETVSFMDHNLQKEYLWQGNPEYWDGQAPFLFPLVGRMPEGKLRIAGKEYPMPLHGFARDSEFTIKEQSDNRLVLTFSDNETTHTMYPFAFTLICSFELNGNVLKVSRTVQNQSGEPMPFCIGEHFGFNLDFNGCTIRDYYIKMAAHETAPIYRVTNRMELSNPEPYFNESDIIRLDEHIFDHDALIFRDLSKNGASVRNDWDEHGVSVYAPDFGQLAFWAMPNAPFVCIEPWCGHISPPNTPIDLEQRCGVLTLPPHCEKTFSTTVTVF